MIKNALKIDLACGDNKKEGFVGIDIVKTSSADYVMDLTQYPWNIESNSVEEINCSHYIEHIPHDTVNLKKLIKDCNTFEEFKLKIEDHDQKDGFIKFFNEIYRILKPDGKVTIVAPYYTSIRAFGDPTHTRYIGDWSFLYLNKEWRNVNKLGHYGIETNFDAKCSYYISNEMTLKSEEVRTNAFQHYWNAIDDIIVELKKL